MKVQKCVDKISGYVEITLKEFTTPISITDNKVILPSGLRCDY